MKIGTKLVVALALIGIVLLAGIVALQPAMIIGSYQLSEYDLSTLDGTTVRGYWIINLSVDQRDTIEFSISDESVSIPADPAKGIPPGSEIRMDAIVSVVLRPAGPPYVSGPVRKWAFCYLDQDFGGTDRVWSFYSLADPMWHVDGLHAPYEVSVKKDGQTIFSPKIYVAGIRGGWDTGTTIQLTSDIQLRQFGQLINGLVFPPAKWAFWWHETSPNNSMWDRTKGTVSKRISPVSDFKTQISGSWGSLDVGWWDPTYNWRNVCWGLELNDVADYYSVYSPKLFGDREGVPGNVVPFPSDPITLYSEIVPKDTEAWTGNMNAWNWKSTSTNYTAIWNLPEASATAVVQLKADASVFDSWIYKPPYGKPEIVKVVAPDWSAGSYGTVQVQVKNVGITEDSFIGELSLPSTIAITQGPGKVSIPEGETKTLSWDVTASPNEYDRDIVGTVKIVAINSGFEDTATVRFKLLAGNSGPVTKVGSVRGIVKDEDGIPIKGATVSCGASWNYTSDQGSFLLTNIQVGSYTLEVNKDGYATHTESVSIVEAPITDVGVIILKRESPVPWGLIIVGIAVALGAIGGVWWLRRK